MTLWRTKTLVIVLACLPLVLSACVTERTPVPGQTRFGVLPTQATATQVIPGAALAATPASISGSRSMLGLKPLGAIAYDGLSLPLISPEGRWAASSAGAPPSWEALLALPDAQVPSTRIEILDLSTLPPRASAAPLDGLMLGRSSTGEGFLVESIRSGGARWIGMVDWATGTLRWLVADSATNSGAIMLRDGTLVYSRRTFDALDASLEIRPAAQPATTISEPGRSLIYPMATPDQSRLVAISASVEALELVVIELGAKPRIVSRIALSAGATPALAYQIVAASDATPPKYGIESLDRTVVVLDPRSGRAKLIDSTRAAIVTIPSDPLAACVGGSGLLVTTASSLEQHTPTTNSSGGLAVARVGTVANSPIMARALEIPGQCVLIAPDSDPAKLQLLRLGMVPSSATPAQR